MKKSILLSAIIILSANTLLKAQDTTTTYYAADGNNVPKIAASYGTKTYYAKGLWHRIVFETAHFSTLKEFSAQDSHFTIKEGAYLTYKNGILKTQILYTDGKKTEESAFYPNGNKLGEIIYASNGEIKEQKGWDPKGKRIKPFIASREAYFLGEKKAWNNFVNKNIDPDLPIKNGAKTNQKYQAVVSFIVDEYGNILDIKIIKDPGFGCGEALKHLMEISPKWAPAIMWNKNVISRRTQPLTWQIE